MIRTSPPSRPLFPIGLLAAALICLPVSHAAGQDPRVLSLAEMALADCVGQALAIERALQHNSATPNGDAAQAATVRADALLHLAVNRHVGIGRIEAFRHRAARTLEGAYLRMVTTMEIGGDLDGIIARTGRQFEAECGAYLD